jgi:hypothetical protein
MPTSTQDKTLPQDNDRVIEQRLTALELKYERLERFLSVLLTQTVVASLPGLKIIMN